MSDHPDPLREKIVKLIDRYENTATVKRSSCGSERTDIGAPHDPE